MLSFVCLLTLGAGAAPAQGAPLTREVPPLDPRVFVLGDSVALGAQPALTAQLGARGWQVSMFAAESLHAHGARG